MKVKEFIDILQKYNPDYNLFISLPPGWYKEEDVEEIWKKEGWTLDSVDYVLEESEEKRVMVCPIGLPKEFSLK